MASLKVRVTPGAREDAIGPWLDDVLRVRVRAKPERGHANEAVCRVLAERLSVAAAAVSVKRGGSSREKLLEVEGLSTEELRRRLGAPML